VTPAPLAERPTVIRRLAAAKVNLTLHITGKRDDGYHLLDSLFVFVDVGDDIEVSPADKLSLVMDGPFGPELSRDADAQDNLVIRAAQLLYARRDQADEAAIKGACIRLIKNLPIAAGVGGGSADAAATLDAVSELWGLSLHRQSLMAIGLELGADVPACIAATPVQVSGIGEVIVPAPPLPVFHLVLVNPGIPLSTAQVFAGLTPEMFSAADPLKGPVGDVGKLVVELEQRHNDLEAPAIKQVPQIAQVLDVLRSTTGCQFARMSGSGATCFGLFEDPNLAAEAAKEIRRSYPNWWAADGAVL
jgi:4-diphosphocytidyl-2-C-methyl-D-erythritol kinase